MALLTPEDIQAALNIDLSTPNGQTLATSLIAAAVAYVEQAVGYPLEEAETVTYFDGDDYRLWLPTSAPVNNLVLSTHNSITGAYDPIDAFYIRHSGTSEVYTSLSLPRGFQSVRATYTTGWTAATLPAGLKQALIDLVGLKLQEVANFSSNLDDPAGDGPGAVTGAMETGFCRTIQRGVRFDQE